MRVQEVYGIDQPGITNLNTGDILIHKGLRAFPRLRKFVIEHEKAHVREKSRFRALWRDLKDYPRMFDEPQYWQWQKKYDNYSVLDDYFMILYWTVIYSWGTILFIFFGFKHRILRGR